MRIACLLAALAVVGCSDPNSAAASREFTTTEGGTLVFNGPVRPGFDLPGSVFAPPSTLRRDGAASPGDRGVSPPAGAVDTVFSMVELCVDAEGRTNTVSVVASSGFPALDAAAVDLVKGTQLTPAKDAKGNNVAYCGFVFPVSWGIPQQG